MKVRLFKKKTILNYVQSNSGSHKPFENWLKGLKAADWNIPSDINKNYAGADLLGRGSCRVIFDIGGNNFRMICQYEFRENEVRLYVCWICSHAEYDRICSLNKQFFIRNIKIFTTMETLKYTVIKNDAQYFRYCDIAWSLIQTKKITPQMQDEIDLLDVLIDKYDDEHWKIPDHDPVELLKSLMEGHNLKAKDISDFLVVSKGYISEILNYKKGFSKEIVRKLADRFKVRQEAFNQPYELKGIKIDRKRRGKSSQNRKSRLKSTKRVRS